MRILLQKIHFFFLFFLFFFGGCGRSAKWIEEGKKEIDLLLSGKKQDASKAIFLFERARHIDPNHPVILRSLAVLYSANPSTLPVSFAYLQRLIQENPHDVESHLALIDIYLRYHQFQKGMEAIQRALKSNPKNCFLALKHIFFLLAFDRTEEAQKIWRSYSSFEQEADPQCKAESQWVEAVLLKKIAKWDEAIAILKPLLKNPRYRLKAKIQLADLFFQRSLSSAVQDGDRKRAKAILDELKKGYPYNQQVQYLEHKLKEHES